MRRCIVKRNDGALALPFFQHWALVARKIRLASRLL